MLLLATCPSGMAHDRVNLQHDHTTALNPSDPDPGKVPEHEPEPVVPTLQEQIRALQDRAGKAATRITIHTPHSEEGIEMITLGATELGRVVTELLGIVQVLVDERELAR
jgi:hypothetical protein